MSSAPDNALQHLTGGWQRSDHGCIRKVVPIGQKATFRTRNRSAACDLGRHEAQCGRGYCATALDRLLSGRSEVGASHRRIGAHATCGGSAGVNMNKRDLIDAISGRLGDKKSATEAVNAVLETIQSAVANGDKVAITGFGVFEKSERPARTARNPPPGPPSRCPSARCRSSVRVPTSRPSSTATSQAARSSPRRHRRAASGNATRTPPAAVGAGGCGGTAAARGAPSPAPRVPVSVSMVPLYLL